MDWGEFLGSSQLNGATLRTCPIANLTSLEIKGFSSRIMRIMIVEISRVINNNDNIYNYNILVIIIIIFVAEVFNWSAQLYPTAPCFPLSESCSSPLRIHQNVAPCRAWPPLVLGTHLDGLRSINRAATRDVAGRHGIC